MPTDASLDQLCTFIPSDSGASSGRGGIDHSGKAVRRAQRPRPSKRKCAEGLPRSSEGKVIRRDKTVQKGQNGLKLKVIKRDKRPAAAVLERCTVQPSVGTKKADQVWRNSKPKANPADDDDSEYDEDKTEDSVPGSVEGLLEARQKRKDVNTRLRQNSE